MPNKSSLKDEQLVELLLTTGSTRHFEEIYRRYFQKVYFQTLSYLKDEEEAQDITQDIFVKLFDRLSKFNNKSSFSTWIFSFSRNAILDYLRVKGRLKEQKVEESTLESIPEVDDDELLQIRSDQLNSILNKLHPEERAILIMMYAHEWKMEEIAENMGISLSAVKMRLKRAKLKVKQLYDESYKT